MKQYSIKDHLNVDYKNIEYNNEKIAKFLGWFKLDDQSDSTWFINDEVANYPVYSLDNYKQKDLPFHRDWNYLMKAFNKVRIYNNDGEYNKNNELYLETFEIGSYTMLVGVGVKLKEKILYFTSFHRYIKNAEPEYSDCESEIEVIYKGIVDFVLLWDKYYKK